MLKDIIDAKDINDKDVMRKSFESTVASFKPDTRVHTKRYELEHHAVVELHGGRYVACVKRGEDALLIETNAKGKKTIVLAVMDTSIYSTAIAEGHAQIKHHVRSTRKSPVAGALEKAKAMLSPNK